MGRKNKRSAAAKASSEKRKAALSQILEISKSYSPENLEICDNTSTVGSVSSFGNSLNETVADLVKRVDMLEADNLNLKNKIDNLNDHNEELAENVYELEVNLAKLDQYGRKENVIIKGVPVNIKQHGLEKYVLNILNNDLGMNLNYYDVVACHRTFQRNTNYPADTIIRFTNRKVVYSIHKNKYKLNDNTKTKGIIILENMCPSYRKLYAESKHYMNEGKIDNVWFYGGKLYVSPSPNIDPVNIFHTDELYWYAENMNNTSYNDLQLQNDQQL